MPILTTCIGAYPKTESIEQANWIDYEDDGSEANTRGFTYALNPSETASQQQFADATRRAVEDQVACGVDIPTDGEQKRENYIHYHCRHFEGLDFETLTRKVHRNGAAVAELPTITGDIRPDGGHFLDSDFRQAQRFTDRPVKITVPGPITIIDTTADTWYNDDYRLARDIADALNFEIRALADAGCRYIQVDEPVFARNVDAALDFGIECLERCFHGLPDNVRRVMHMCCGYPGHLDDEDYAKADPAAYARLAGALDDICVDDISIEDAHRHNNLELLEQFSQSTVIFGSIAVARSRIESVDEIAERLSSALNHIDRDRLVAAPDCGLAMLDRQTAMKKLKRMCDAASQF